MNLGGKIKNLSVSGAPATWFFNKGGRILSKYIGAFTNFNQEFTRLKKAFMQIYLYLTLLKKVLQKLLTI